MDSEQDDIQMDSEQDDIQADSEQDDIQVDSEQDDIQVDSEQDDIQADSEQHDAEMDSERDEVEVTWTMTIHLHVNHVATTEAVLLLQSAHLDLLTFLDLLISLFPHLHTPSPPCPRP